MSRQTYPVTGRIDSVEQKKSLFIVKIDGKEFVTKTHEIQNHVGAIVRATCSDSEWQGRVSHWINEFVIESPASQAPQTASAAPQASHPGWTDKDRSIFVQAMSKAVLSPEMSEEQIRSRVQFLWGLTEEMELWAKMGVPSR